MTDMVIHTYNPSIQESEAGRSQALSSQYKILFSREGGRKGRREEGRKIGRKEICVSFVPYYSKLVHYSNDTFLDPL